MISSYQQTNSTPAQKTSSQPASRPPATGTIQGIAQAIEKKARALRLPVKVTQINLLGDKNKPSGYEWIVSPIEATRIESLSRIEGDLSAAAGLPLSVVKTGGGGVVIRFLRDGVVETDYAALLASVAEQGGRRPIMGIGFSHNGQPILADISSPSAAHIGIFSQTQSGKTNLSQVMLSTLCATSSPRDVGICIIDHKNNAAFASHIGKHVIGHAINSTQWIDALRRMRAIMDERRAKMDEFESWQHLVVYCDELGEVVDEGGEEIASQFASIARRGAGLKVHMMVATQRPSADEIASVVRSNITLRIVGRVNSANEATMAAGCGGTGAERIAKPGHFIIVKGDKGQHAHVFTPMMTVDPKHRVTNTIFSTVSTPVKPLASTIEPEIPRTASAQVGSEQDEVDPANEAVGEEEVKLAHLVARVAVVLVSASDAAHLPDNEILRRCKLVNGKGEPILRSKGSTFHARWTKALQIARENIDSLRKSE